MCGVTELQGGVRCNWTSGRCAVWLNYRAVCGVTELQGGVLCDSTVPDVLAQGVSLQRVKVICETGTWLELCTLLRCHICRVKVLHLQCIFMFLRYPELINYFGDNCLCVRVLSLRILTTSWKFGWTCVLCTTTPTECEGIILISALFYNSLITCELAHINLRAVLIPWTVRFEKISHTRYRRYHVPLSTPYCASICCFYALLYWMRTSISTLTYQTTVLLPAACCQGHFCINWH